MIEPAARYQSVEMGSRLKAELPQCFSGLGLLVVEVVGEVQRHTLEFIALILPVNGHGQVFIFGALLGDHQVKDSLFSSAELRQMWLEHVATDAINDVLLRSSACIGGIIPRLQVTGT